MVLKVLSTVALRGDPGKNTCRLPGSLNFSKQNKGRCRLEIELLEVAQ